MIVYLVLYLDVIVETGFTYLNGGLKFCFAFTPTLSRIHQSAQHETASERGL